MTCAYWILASCESECIRQNCFLLQRNLSIWALRDFSTLWIWFWHFERKIICERREAERRENQLSSEYFTTIGLVQRGSNQCCLPAACTLAVFVLSAVVESLPFLGIQLRMHERVHSQYFFNSKWGCELWRVGSIEKSNKAIKYPNVKQLRS